MHYFCSQIDYKTNNRYDQNSKLLVVAILKVEKIVRR